MKIKRPKLVLTRAQIIAVVRHTGKTITWDKPMLNRFKMAINKAKGMKGDTFTFDGHEFVIGYAEYLAEYLDERLK